MTIATPSGTPFCIVRILHGSHVQSASKLVSQATAANSAQCVCVSQLQYYTTSSAPRDPSIKRLCRGIAHNYNTKTVMQILCGPLLLRHSRLERVQPRPHWYISSSAHSIRILSPDQFSSICHVVCYPAWLHCHHRDTIASVMPVSSETLCSEQLAD